MTVHRSWRPPVAHSRRDRPLGVSELARAVNDHVRMIGRVTVVGELTGWHRSAPGHCYFSLRQGEDAFPCVMFRGNARALTADPSDGHDVAVVGEVNYYGPLQCLRLIVRELDATGADGLHKREVERARARLQARGLLDRPRRKLPKYPRKVGVVAAAESAALTDVLATLWARAPWVDVIVSPAPVQGEGAAHEIVRALRALEQRPDVNVVILCRGGGSPRDLWVFDDAELCEAVATCRLPTISAVGHEKDVPLCDYVADVRAATPTAAAVSAAPDGAVLLQRVHDLTTSIAASTRRAAIRARTAADQARTSIDAARQRRFQAVVSRLSARAPAHLLATLAGRASSAQQRLSRSAPPILCGLLARRADQAQRTITERRSVAAGQMLLRIRAAHSAQRSVSPEHMRSSLAKLAHAAAARADQASPDRLRGSVLRILARQRGRLEHAGAVALRPHLRQLARADARRLSELQERIESLSPRGVLARGYAILRDGGGRILRSVAAATSGARLRVQVADGEIDVQVRDPEPGG